MTTISKSGYIIVIIILFVPFIFGTSPLPPPYHEYRVTGNVARQSGGAKENYVVSLLGYSPSSRPDTIFVLRSSTGLHYGVTDTNGYFSVDVISRIADSVAIVVSAPDKTPFISNKWFASSGSSTLYEENMYSEPGCSGCGTETKTERHIKGYLHTFQPQTVLLPN